MKIPAIKAKLGDWDYYSAVLTFEQISKYVSKIDDELYQSESLRDLLQRSITENFKSIKEYILLQKEHFFNSLILAVYDDYPDWKQIVMKFEGDEYTQFGLLEFPGTHKIFPVDGQHRVEGIKAAIKEDPKLKTQEIGVIIIGHKDSPAGKKRTRRLFTTLNRYAKPVSLRDSIALDEDDSVAIVTRRLIENHPLFKGNRIVDVKGKGIPQNNKEAFTSIISLYQSNLEIFRYYMEFFLRQKPNKANITKYLKFRPADDELQKFEAFCRLFWSDFSESLTEIKGYLKRRIYKAEELRNSDNGGNLLFRPVGLEPFIQANFSLKRRTKKDQVSILKKFNTINLVLNKKPWAKVLWDDINGRMITNSKNLTYLLLLYLFDKSILSERELEKLRNGYSLKLGIEDENEIRKVLDRLK